MQKNNRQYSYIGMYQEIHPCLQLILTVLKHGNDKGMGNICSSILGPGLPGEKRDLGEFAECRHTFSPSLLLQGMWLHNLTKEE